MDDRGCKRRRLNNMANENDMDAISVLNVEIGSTSDPESACYGKNHRRRNIAIVSVIAAVVVLAGGAGGYAYAASNVQKGADAAQANAQAVDQKLAEKIAEAQELLDGTEEEQVADAQTLTDLSDAIDKAQKLSGVDAVGANRWLVWQELDAQTAYDADSADASDAISRLDKAMDAVTGSVDAKTLADAKQALQSTVDNAGKTYVDSDGKVQDNATRDSLKSALDAAKKVLNDDSVTTAQKYTDQKMAVDNAVKIVNDSITAKEKADAEAAASSVATFGSPYSGSGSSNYSGETGSYYDGGVSDPDIIGPYTTDNEAGAHQFWKDLSSGKTCTFSSEAGDSDFNDNPMTCQ